MHHTPQGRRRTVNLPTAIPTYEIKYSRQIRSDVQTPTIRNSQQAASYILTHCYPSEKDLWRENAWAVYVDANGKAVGQLLLGTGGFSNTTIDLKLVFKAALDCQAHAIILTHNHPSGNPLPTEYDIKETDRLREACKTMQFTLLDHIIIGEKEWYSFREETTRPIPFQEIMLRTVAGEATPGTAAFIHKALNDFMKENPTGDSFELATYMYNLGHDAAQNSQAR